MPVDNIPDDILYVVFQLVGLDRQSPATHSNHLLLPLKLVCKRWKSVAVELIHVDLGISKVDGLLRVLHHLSGGTVEADVARGRRDSGRSVARLATTI